MILSHPLYLQAQRCDFDLRIEHAPDEIALTRPQVQQAFVVLAGN